MLGAETVIGPIIKLVVSVAILAAVGVFIVKPILETTEEISESVRGSIEEGNQASQEARVQAERSRAQSYAQSLQSTWPAAAREIKRCVAGAGSLTAMERCAELGQRLVHTVQSDRTFALSYADSLDGRGETAAADRVRECVRDAGFQTAAMHQCRELADDLLFG